MRTMVVMAFVLLPSSIFGAPCGSNLNHIIPIHVAATVGNDDNVASRFVFRLREDIRGSQGFCLAEDDEHALITAHVVTVREDTNGYTSAIALAVSAPLKNCDHYLGASVFVVGASKGEQVAESAMADIDEDSKILRDSKP